MKKWIEIAGLLLLILPVVVQANDYNVLSISRVSDSLDGAMELGDINVVSVVIHNSGGVATYVTSTLSLDGESSAFTVVSNNAPVSLAADLSVTNTYALMANANGRYQFTAQAISAETNSAATSHSIVVGSEISYLSNIITEISGGTINGKYEPGEMIGITVVNTNNGAHTVTNVINTLSANPSYFTITPPSATYLVMAVGNSTSTMYTVAISSATPAGSHNFSVTNQAGSQIWTNQFTLCVFAQEFYYSLTVAGGTGSGLYTNQQQVAIAAGVPEFGNTFYRWAGETQYLNSVTSSNTTVTMPASDITVTATYTALNAGDFTCTTSNDTITITGYTGSGSAVTIPDTIDGLPVTGIGANAFLNCSNLISVTIPDSISSIGSAPFSACTNLATIIVGTANTAYSSVDGVLFNKSQTTLVQYPAGKSGSDYTIPDSVTVIAGGSFLGGTRLTGFTMPNSVASIGNNAFKSCSSLTNATIGNSVTNIGNNAFSSCSNLTSVTIGNSVIGIEYSAFYHCTSLTNIMIPNSVIFIGNGTFNGCSNLISATIGNSVTSIGTNAFNSCSSLTRVTIGNSVTSIGDWAFMHCISLAGIYFQGNAPDIGLSVLFDAGNVTVYYLPRTAGWPTVPSRWANRPTALWLTVSGGSTIGSYTNLPQVTIAASAPPSGKIFDQWIGDTQYVDSVTSSIATVTLPAQNISLAATYASLDYIYTTSNGTITITGYTGSGGAVDIPDTIDGSPVTGIGANAFLSCSNLTSVTIPAGIIGIGNGPFSVCTNLTSITVSTASTAYVSINGVLFNKSQTKLVQYPAGKSGSDYTIPDNITIIAGGAFWGCNSLTGITVSGSVTNFGGNAFRSCASLTGVYFMGNPPSIGANMFTGDDNATVYYLPWATGWETTFGGRPTALWQQQPESDTDTDGIPDSWEQQYFGNATNANPDTVCSNGFNTVREAYIAGLNPNDPQSAFRTSVLNGRTLRWNAVSWRSYSIYWTTNLLSGFQCLESNIPWTRASFTNSATVPCGYYKVGIYLDN